MDDGCYLRIGYGAVNAAVMEAGMERLVAGITALTTVTGLEVLSSRHLDD